MKTKLIPFFPKFKLFSLKKVAFFFTFLLLFVSLTLGLFAFFLADKIYPFIFVANVNVSFLTPSQAKTKIIQEIKKNRTIVPLNFSYQESTASSTNQSISINLNQSGVDLDSAVDRGIDSAWQYGRKTYYTKTVNLPIYPEFNHELTDQLTSMSQQINEPPIDSQLQVDPEGQITITASQTGKMLDQSELKKQLISFLNTGSQPSFILPVKIIQPKLSYEAALTIKRRLDQIKLNPLSLTYKDLTYALDLSQILELIDLENSTSSLAQSAFFDQPISLKSAQIGDQEYSDTKLSLNSPKATAYFQSLAKDIDRPVEEPLFSLEGDEKNPRIKEFRPPQMGQQLDIEKAKFRLSQALLTDNQTTIEIPVTITEPKNKLTNELGVKELIGRGVSHFSGSIENRIFNVYLGASKINGVLIPPGETFSFTGTVGDITAATGFKQAYVIKSGRTVLDDGGGICQVSTTLFRAALNAGVPIVSRTAHAYRVGYYEQGFAPGIDATIFYPSVDFKFKNDTPNHILIQAYGEGTTLTVDLYGTSDGRITSVSTPRVLNQTPAPPELRQDDPTLPKGTVKQVDFAAAGANVIFTRTVTKNGATLQNDTFRSNYRPWQAVFLVGTKEG